MAAKTKRLGHPMSKETRDMLAEKRKQVAERKRLLTIYREVAASYVNGLRDMGKR